MEDKSEFEYEVYEIDDRSLWQKVQEIDLWFGAIVGIIFLLAILEPYFLANQNPLHLLSFYALGFAFLCPVGWLFGILVPILLFKGMFNPEYSRNWKLLRGFMAAIVLLLAVISFLPATRIKVTEWGVYRRVTRASSLDVLVEKARSEIEQVKSSQDEDPYLDLSPTIGKPLDSRFLAEDIEAIRPNRAYVTIPRFSDEVVFWIDFGGGMVEPFGLIVSDQDGARISDWYHIVEWGKGVYFYCHVPDRRLNTPWF